ncbi:uncharacterized protein K452DRAFT_108943 [Aplosporella prunicola CBS 121167]|uniref:Uncharacterized protein n=1 Tax=Aplosporella prunicola CBS 121167 TaxID=1176127 RepID=A0A6A6BQM7_9PEZI|nr:uncharacterized protein K452DRAFT_108943 [Aplosporella prunicola CBS 121167]KAF2146310.1 hypothetical protein K452DRAFT_108943 [Aplosporella prunicola CBS 121167]
MSFINCLLNLYLACTPLAAPNYAAQVLLCRPTRRIQTPILGRRGLGTNYTVSSGGYELVPCEEGLRSDKSPEALIGKGISYMPRDTPHNWLTWALQMSCCGDGGAFLALLPVSLRMSPATVLQAAKTPFLVI